MTVEFTLWQCNDRQQVWVTTDDRLAMSVVAEAYDAIPIAQQVASGGWIFFMLPRPLGPIQ